ncbi:hypothetical protein HWB57_gp007 [Erwinia phage vB_EamM-Bue1]|uniref:Uncharacterized protein n=1 Tax=Erwinia phage vB_EamM-Bue1 TaxID=2099338 RepID=A0A2P1JU24_9CAUD|nr:hypothetical protein HWB57_gp007 [Erwinia phage vB_EamM-Bue1]AVO22850.1 hypothetical protein [Erwinia phage vB_EamM-Bue1]
MSVQTERRFKDVVLGILCGVCGTLAYDNLVNMIADTGMTKFRFVLFVLFAGVSIWCFLKGTRRI